MGARAFRLGASAPALMSCMAVAGLSACGRLGYSPQDVQADDGGAGIVDGDPTVIDADPDDIDAAPILPMPIFYIDAANVDGANSAGSDGCPGMGTSTWQDLASVATGSLLNFGLPPCDPTSGWKGDGTPANPHRLVFEDVASQGVSFGTIAHTPVYTVEAWIRWTGNGTQSSTGTGGINVYPIVAKGTGENEITEIDENYFLGIAPAGATIGADFEESVNHDNHPLLGNTVLVAGEWIHLAMSYDQAELVVYINGVADAELATTDPASVAVDSILGVGANYLSTGGSDGGFFDGDIALVRIFDIALSTAQILAECEAFDDRFSGLVCGS